MITFESGLGTIPLKAIHFFVCKRLNISEKDLFKKTRRREIVLKRQIFFYLVRKITSVSYYFIINYISQYNGTKSHCTLMHSVKTINNLIYSNREIRELVAELYDELITTKVVSICVLDVDLVESAEKNNEHIKDKHLNKILYEQETTAVV